MSLLFMLCQAASYSAELKRHNDKQISHLIQMEYNHDLFPL